MFRALLLCSNILPSDRPIVWQTCINTSKPALHGFKYLQRSSQEGSFLVLTVSKSFSVIPWFSRTVSEGGIWDAVAVVWLWREGIIWVGERPETRTVMMLMVLIKHLYFRYCGMCFTQMVTFDSHNDPRVIDFLFYRWGHWRLAKLRFPFKVYTASSGRARIWTRIFECSLACCSPWGRKESDMTEQLKNNLSTGGDRGWDGWMASPTQGTWVWVSSGSWCGQGSLACCSPWQLFHSPLSFSSRGLLPTLHFLP